MLAGRLVIVYQDFSYDGVCDLGLAVTARHTAHVLCREGIAAEVWPARHQNEITCRLQQPGQDGIPDHVLIMAPWISTTTLKSMVGGFAGINFTLCSHSNLGYVHGDPNGMRLLRDAMDLQRAFPNFRFAVNSQRFSRWIESAYRVFCAHLPNLYDLAGERRHARPPGKPLRIGAFGSPRPLKNLITAAGAALQIAVERDSGLDLWLSSDGCEDDKTLETIRAMLARVPLVNLVEQNWQPWAQFRSTVGRMNLLIHPSYSESFGMIPADGVAEGVPSVVSDAIEWAPESWKAKVDDAGDIARIGQRLLDDPRAVEAGFDRLLVHNQHGVQAWRAYLSRPAGS